LNDRTTVPVRRVILLAIGFSAWTLMVATVGSNQPSTGEPVRVITTSLPRFVPPSIVAPTRLATPAQQSTDPAMAAAHAAREYAMLRDVSLQCSGERCGLSGRIVPVSAQADLDKRQELLLGGLAAVLAQDGYRLAEPLSIKEVDDNLFTLQATVLPLVMNGRE
jgi:hypothetical protein